MPFSLTPIWAVRQDHSFMRTKDIESLCNHSGLPPFSAVVYPVDGGAFDRDSITRRVLVIPLAVTIVLYRPLVPAGMDFHSRRVGWNCSRQ